MKKRLSAADIFPAAATSPAVPTIDGIKRMLDECGTSNRNDLLVIAITALINAGVNTRPRIVGAATSIGFKPAHAGAVLGKSERGNPDRHSWQRGSDGIYRVHPAVQEQVTKQAA